MRERGNPSVERAAQAVALAASAWFALAMTWGLFARIGGGHEVQSATRAIIAENMRTWHILAPVKDYWLGRPGPTVYYVHHPWGMFWVIAAFAEVLGRGTWVPRLVAVLASMAIPPLLYGIGRALWGPVPGAISALAYTVLPIALAFGSHPGFELSVIFTCLVATWGYLRFTERWQRGWMFVSLAGVLAIANSDWQGFVFIGTVLFALVVGRLLLPRWFGRVPVRPFVEWWIGAALLSGATLAAYLLYFRYTGMLKDLFQSETMRSRGSETPLADLLSRRSYWLDISFTPLAITVGKIAAPIFVARLVLWRRLHEIFPLAILLMAVVEYLKFPNGANVHIYWPMPFAPYWALSLGMLSAVTGGIARRVLLLAGVSASSLVSFGALTIFGAIALAVLPDGIRGLRYAKATGGRFDEKGRRIFQDVDLEQAMEWMAERMVPNTVVGVLSELYSRENRGQEWALHRPMQGASATQYSVSATGQPYFVGDLRFMTALEQRGAAEKFHVITLGPYIFIDRSEHGAPIDAYSFDEREPNLFQWYFESPTEPMRTVRADPWRTWEVRDQYGQSPNPAPSAPPKTLEEIRIAHNVAVSTGDTATAEMYKARLISAIDTSVATRFNDGTRLLGGQFIRGVDPKLELYFLAEGPLADEFLFDVSSNIESPPRWSLVPADPKTKKYTDPFVVSPRLWRSGFIYLDLVDIRQRPGREHFAGRFVASSTKSPPAPTPVNDSGQIELMTIE